MSEVPQIGTSVKVYWTEEKKWYCGVIVAHIDSKMDPQGREGLAQIRYDADKSLYVHDFTFETWRHWIRQFECVYEKGVAYRYVCGDMDSRVRVPRGPNKGEIVIAKEVKRNWIRVENPANRTGGDFWLPLNVGRTEIEEEEEEEEKKAVNESEESEEEIEDDFNDSKMDIDGNGESDLKDENEFIEEYPCSIKLKNHKFSHENSNQVRKCLYASGLTDIFSMVFSEQENSYETISSTSAPETMEERAHFRAGEIYQFRSSDMIELSQAHSWRDWWRPDTSPRLIFSFALFHPNKGTIEQRAQNFNYYAACAVDFVRRKRQRWKDCKFVAHLGEDVGPTVMRNLYRAADGCMKILKYVVIGGEDENNDVGAQSTFTISHWRCEGHEFIGKRVRRHFDATGTIDGVVTMWLPPMYDDLDIWRVQYVFFFSLSLSLLHIHKHIYSTHSTTI